jgi:hypothetical protein
MYRVLHILFVLAIVFGLYIGVRYVGSVIHYACADPAEDCAPPIHAVGELGWYSTGGGLVPFWRQD